MDYVIGFALGYLFNKFLLLLSNLSNYNYDNSYTYKENNEKWDWIDLTEDDLP